MIFSMHILPAILMSPGAESGGIVGLMFPLLLIVVFYFFLIRPQTKRQREIQNKVNEMKKGDKVITNGGVIGTVNSIDDDSVLLDVDTNVKIRFMKSSVIDVNPNKK